MIASSLVASVTVTVTAVVVVYTQVKCPDCHRRLFDMPGTLDLDVRSHPSPDRLTGRGVATRCPRCKTQVEATLRRPAA